MSELLLFSGVAQGMLYALVGLGFTLVFRAANVANFAVAGLSAGLAFAGFEYVSRGGPGGYLAALVVVAILGAGMGWAVYRGLIARFPSGDLLVLLVVTVGLNFVLTGIIEARYAKHEPYAVSSPFSSTEAIVGGVTPQHLAIVVVTALALGLIWAFLHKTRSGLEIQAVAENVESARAIGLDVRRARTLTWMIGTSLLGVAALLFAPLLFLDTSTNGLLMHKALAGAVLGGLGSLPGAVVGGILLGVIEKLAVPIAPEASDAAVFVVILLVLLLKPEGLLGRREVRKL